jgi:hypothetical protein
MLVHQISPGHLDQVIEMPKAGCSGRVEGNGWLGSDDA